ncbi:MAG TPA: COX15/CtaA family protein, partial [Candidatus Limnocylindria bacterium]|nr:COX15/CtaA family protein [Candidatus Limnocylindria bacterium]
MTRFAKLAIAAAAATYVLIVVGGLVRATDSGLGCPDWPLCFGAWVPPAELHAWIEHSHRLVAAVAVGPLVGAVALITVFTSRRQDRPLLVAAVVAGVLVIVQAVLGGQVVIQGLARELVTAHLAMALTVLAMTILIADRASHGPMPGRPSALPIWLIGLTALAVFAQMLLGSWVTGHDAGLAYGDFPLMGGRVIPVIGGVEQAINVAHRALAVVVLALVLWMARAVRRSTASALPRRLAGAAAVLVLVQLALGAANIWSRLSAVFVVPHLAVGAALFAACAWLLLAALREPIPVGADAAPPGSGRTERGDLRRALSAYIALTKPRIIELLLVTTVPTMVLAQQTTERGLPSPWLMAAVIIGGTMAAGGANAINQYVDRDIDDVMRRTRHRPLPRHAVTPQNALFFGIALSVVSFAW